MTEILAKADEFQAETLPMFWKRGSLNFVYAQRDATSISAGDDIERSQPHRFGQEVAHGGPRSIWIYVPG